MEQPCGAAFFWYKPTLAKFRRERGAPAGSASKMHMETLFRPLASALLLAITLGGCGGETSNEAPAETWQYAALGDSLAVGVLAERGYVPRYQQHIQAGTVKTVILTNLGVNGWQSSDLLAALRSDARFRNAVRRAQVVTWDIGGNDLRAVRLEFIRGTCGGA